MLSVAPCRVLFVSKVFGVCEQDQLVTLVEDHLELVGVNRVDFATALVL
jgi:hypothetical protein